MDTIEAWLRHLETERRYSALTVAAYHADLMAFVNFVTDNRSKKFDAIVIIFKDLRAYVMVMIERGDNPRSVNRHISALKSYFKYLNRCGVTALNPTLKLRTLPIESRLPEFIPTSKSEQIVRRLMEWSEDPVEQRNSLIMMLLFTTGMRRAELVSLRRDNVDIGQQKIRVIGKGSKEREIPLLPEVAKILEQYLHNDICVGQEKFVFLSKKLEPISTDEVYRIVRKSLEEAGVQGKQSPHVIRHTFATMLLSQGSSLSSIQALMGHANLASTQIYTHNTIERLVESYKKAHPRAQNINDTNKKSL